MAATSARPPTPWASPGARSTGAWRSMDSDAVSRRATRRASLVRRLRPLSFEARILLLALAVGLPGTAAALLLLWVGPYSPRIQWLLTAVLAVAWWWLAENLGRSVVRPLQTMSNLLHAVREG